MSGQISGMTTIGNDLTLGKTETRKQKRTPERERRVLHVRAVKNWGEGESRAREEKEGKKVVHG